MSLKKVLISTLILLLLFGFYFRRNIYTIYTDVILDNKYHGVSCENLPSYDEAQRVVAQKKELVSRIKNVHPSEDLNSFYISVEVHEVCTGRGEIVIGYPSHNDRTKIEEILKDDSFNEIPYNLINY